MKQDSDYYEWWYSQMVPDEDYILLKKDVSDVLDKVKWAIDNDERARGIAENGARKAESILSTENMFCYYVKAFDLFSRKLTRPAKLYDDHEWLKEDKDRERR